MPAKRGPLRPHEERQNYTRREPVEPLPGDPELGDSFLIVTEGEVTEKLYFESVREMLQLSPVTLSVVHPDCTDAVGLVQAAIDMYEWRGQTRASRNTFGNRQVKTFDHVWVLFDTDVPEVQAQLEDALALARQERIHIAHSTPSAEVWLLLHFRDRPGPLLNSDQAEQAVGEAWGEAYDKSAKTFLKLWPALNPNIPDAVVRGQRIREYHRDAATAYPANPSTDLDLLVRALNASVRPELRIFAP